MASSLKKIRQEILPHLITFTTEAMRSSMPVIRPLWMLDSSDHVCQTINDEFLIGDKVIKINTQLKCLTLYSTAIVSVRFWLLQY